jgi:glutamate-1-semialdehyde 2,1-aminomutase
MMTLFFNSSPVNGWSTAKDCDTKAYARYFWEMASRGVYLPCSQFEVLFVSAAHDEREIDLAIGATSDSLAAISK